MSEDQLLICLKRWVVRGFITVDTGASDGRKQHKKLGPARKHLDKPLTDIEITQAVSTKAFTHAELVGL